MSWLSGMDSNHDKELQRLLCYHYTTGQDRHKLAATHRQRKGKTLPPEWVTIGGFLPSYPYGAARPTTGAV